MNIFQKIGYEISWFFTVDIPMYFAGMSTGTKIFLLVLLILLSPAIIFLLHLAIVLIFLSVMTLFTSNLTYETLHPVEEIAVIEIVEITESVDLYSHRLDTIPALLDANTTLVIQLDASQTDACMEDLFDLSASEWWNDPTPCIRNGTMRITYRNGSREWICSDGVLYYDSTEGAAHISWYYFSDDEFLSYLLEYGYRKP